MKRRGFSLIEVLLAILFISIGFFGYVALQGRILYSTTRLQQKADLRRSISTISSIDQVRARERERIGSIMDRAFTWFPDRQSLRHVSTIFEPRPVPYYLQGTPAEAAFEWTSDQEIDVYVFYKPNRDKFIIDDGNE